jgi:hypothetical protein
MALRLMQAEGDFKATGDFKVNRPEGTSRLISSKSEAAAVINGPLTLTR